MSRADKIGAGLFVAIAILVSVVLWMGVTMWFDRWAAEVAAEVEMGDIWTEGALEVDSGSDLWVYSDTVDTGLIVRDGLGSDIGIELEVDDTIYYYNHELPGEHPQAMGCSLQWVCDD